MGMIDDGIRPPELWPGVCYNFIAATLLTFRFMCQKCLLKEIIKIECNGEMASTNKWQQRGKVPVLLQRYIKFLWCVRVNVLTADL